MELRVVDGDPEQAERLHGWFKAHPGWSLEHVRGCTWRLTDGTRERKCRGWREVLNALDEAGRSSGAHPDGGRPASPGTPPDIIA